MLYHIHNQQDTKSLAETFALQAKSGDVFCLKGTLGAGKSFFAACFINALLDKKVEVLSPTFNLLYSYQASKNLIHHFDLFRLKNAEELENIGFFDCIKDGICLIEWPEIAEKFLPKHYTEINIEIKSENERLITVKKL